MGFGIVETKSTTSGIISSANETLSSINGTVSSANETLSSINGTISLADETLSSGIDLSIIVQICQIFLLGVLLISVLLTYFSLRNEAKQKRADFHLNMDKFRTNNKNFRIIRAYLYKRDLPHIKKKISRLPITMKLDFINFYEFIYALVQSDFMSISAADNYFGALVTECVKCTEFWEGKDETNRFKNGQKDPRAKMFMKLNDEIKDYREVRDDIEKEKNKLSVDNKPSRPSFKDSSVFSSFGSYLKSYLKWMHNAHKYKKYKNQKLKIFNKNHQTIRKDFDSIKW